MLHYCTHPDCGASFNRPYKLRAHLNIHENTKVFKCFEESCNKTFFTSSGLTKHKRRNHCKNFKVNVSCKTDIFESTEQDNEYRFCCGQCKTIYNDALSYYCHSKKCATYICTVSHCCCLFYNYDLYEQHIIHLHPKLYLCATCKFTFNKKKYLCKHVKKHFVCKCNVDSCSGKLWPAILERVQSDELYQCEHCNFICRSKVEIYRHIVRHKVYVCEEDYCSDSFSRYVDLRKHWKEKHPRNFQCDRCKSKFLSKSQLRTHIQLCYKVFDDFKCPVPDCNKRFRYKRNLTVHIKVTHKCRVFRCPFLTCQKLLRHMKSYREHIALHANNKIKCKPLKKPKLPYSTKLALRLCEDFST